MIVDESNVKRSVVKLALPSVLEQVLFMIVGIVSTIFVGRINTEAMSAVGLINTLVGFIIALFVAVSTGSTVVVARLIGEGDVSQAKETVRQSIVVGTAASCVLSVLCYIFAIPIINLFFGKAEAQVVELADIYFKITLYTFPLLLINTIVSGNFRGAGDTKTPMIIAYIVNIMNVVLSYFFIIKCGFGIHGAAWAVAVSRGAGGVLSLGALLLPGNVVKFDVLDKYCLRLDIIKRVFNVGVPAALEQIVMQGGFLVLQIVISGMGTTAIAVYQVGMSINSISFIPIWGFGIAATTLIGQSLGAGKPELAEKSGWVTIKLALVITTALTALIFVFSGQLVALYSKDSEVIRIGASAIKIFCISQPFLTVVCVISGALRGAGDILYVMITSFVGIWGFRILITILLNVFFNMGIMGVWIALCLDFFIRSIMYLVRYRRGRWKIIRV